MVNKFQTGGIALGSILQELAKLPKDKQEQIMAAFGKWALDKGFDMQQLQSDTQALEQAMGQFLAEIKSKKGQKQQQTVTARLGTKLNYVRKLKGDCPEGQTLVYFKEGGRVCKKCIAKGQEGVQTGKDVIETFKAKKGNKVKACGGSKMKFEFGGETPEKPVKKETKKETKKEVKKEQRLDPKTTKTLPGGKYPTYWTASLKQTWERLYGDNDEGAGVVENKGVGKNKCGGKTKKHLLGGIIGF